MSYQTETAAEIQSLPNFMEHHAERYDPQQRPKPYTCPVCGERLEGYATLYKTYGLVVGCIYCIQETSPWAELEE